MIQMNCMYRTLLAAVALAFSSVTASAETITVCADGCDYTSINAAIDAASDGDVIQLAAETYFEGEQISTLGKAITLRGVLDKAGEPASVLDGAVTHRVLNCQSGETSTTVFENLVIQRGYANPSLINCGGMMNGGSSPTLTNCTFWGNRAYLDGGGMYNDNGSSPTLTDCTFENNSSTLGDGGGMVNDNGSNPTLTNCTFTSNSAKWGGGMVNYNGSNPALTDCTFTNNSADVDGGGMYNDNGKYDGSSLTLTNCTFTNNSSGRYGGGMWNYVSILTLVDCTFAGNTVTLAGGGMANAYGIPFLINCTFTECCQIYPPRSITDLGGNDYDSWCDDCRADVNCRYNAVNAADLGILIGSWGTNDPQCDINGDGTVSAADLGLLIGAWGPCQ